MAALIRLVISLEVMVHGDELATDNLEVKYRGKDIDYGVDDEDVVMNDDELRHDAECEKADNFRSSGE